MRELFFVCASILTLILVASALWAAGLPGYQAVAFTLFGGVVGGMLLIAIRLAFEDKTRHVD